MPGLITHHLFGIDAYKNCRNKQIRKIIKTNPKPFFLGLQGPDIYLYHLPYLKYKDKRNVGTYLHKNEMQRFFDVYVDRLEAMHGREHLTCLSYLFGSLCHYALDTNCHPFVYGRIGYDVNSYGNEEYVRHAKLELEIDRCLLYRTRSKPLTTFPYADVFHLSRQETYSLVPFLTSCLTDLNISMTQRRLYYILRECRMESILLTDRSGRRTAIIEWLEKLFLKMPLLSVKLINDRAYQIEDYLNNRKNEWKNPWNKDKISTASFQELYEQSLPQTLDFWRAAYHCVLSMNTTRYRADKEIFLTTIGNLSYHSGLSPEEEIIG